MSEDNIRKRRINRPPEEIAADINERIMKHEKQIKDVQEKLTKTIAYHKACIETLTVKREAALNPKKRSSNITALMAKMKEKGLTIDDILQKIDDI